MAKFNLDIEDPKITAIGVAAIIDFYRTLAIEVFEDDGVIAFFTGMDSPFLNVAIDSRTIRTNSAATIAAVTQFFNQHSAPWSWFVTPASRQHDLEAQGFSLLEEAPAMYFDLTQSIPDDNNASIKIEEMGPDSDLKIWIQPINEGFQAKENDDSYRQLNATLLHQGVKKLRHYVAYYDNQVATAATLFLTDEAVMIHNVATKTHFLKKGLGTAITLYLMKEAKKLGFKHCYLDSSEDGFKLYQKLGFKVYSTTLVYQH